MINIIDELLQNILSLGIFSLEDPFGRNIVRLIFYVFWLGVINYAVHMLRIGYNYFCLKRVQSYIKNNHGLGDISPSLLDKLRAQEFIVQNYLVISSIYKRIRDLVHIKQNGGEIDNDVLGDIHAGAASRKAGLSNYILGILIILGLIGTLKGLITAIIEVQPLLRDIQDLDQLPTISNALQRTLSGMSTAFVTTFAGLVTSLGLGLCGWLFNLSNSAFLTKFETVVSTEIIPHFTQAPESAVESSTDRLQVSVDEFKLATEDNVRKMEQAIQQLTEQSWEAYLEQQYVITQELSEIPAELRGSLGGINEYQVLIRSTVESSEETAKQFMNKISEFQTTVDTMVNDFKTMTEGTISQVSGYQATLLGGLENVVSELRAESTGLTTTIREAQRAQSQFVNELTNNLAHTLTNALETQLQSVLQPITDSQQAIIEGLREGELNIRSAVSQVSDYQTTLLVGLETVVSELKEESAELKTTIRENQRAQAIFADGLATNLADTLTEYQTTLLAGLGNVLSGLKEESGGLKTTVREAQNSQARFVDELAGTLTTTLENQLQSMLQPIIDRQQVMIEDLREGELMVTRALESQNQVFESIKTDLVTNRHEVGNRLSLLIGELQIKPTLEAQNEVFGRIEGHLQGQREMVEEQREIMRTLDTSVKQLERTFSSAASDEQERTEKMLKQLSSNFETLSEKIEALNHTMSQPGFSLLGRLFRGDRKE